MVADSGEPKVVSMCVLETSRRYVVNTYIPIMANNLEELKLTCSISFCFRNIQRYREWNMKM